MLRKYKLKGKQFEAALRSMLEAFKNRHQTILIPTVESLGYILAEDIYSTEDLPRFNMAFYDGYAVKSDDISDASPDNPIKLKLMGHIYKAGDEKNYIIRDGEAVYVSANSPIPRGSDLVVRKELVILKDKHVIIRRKLDRGENIIYKGEDFKKGDILLKKGRIIKPRDITLLLELGIYRVMVFKKPTVGIIAIGTELKEKLDKGEPYPNNYSILLHKILKLMGAKPFIIDVLPDEVEIIREKILNYVDNYDILLLIGGVSVGDNDYTGYAVSEIGGVIFHGTNLSPGKVSGIVKIKNKPVFLVPGHILSAISCLYNFVYRLICNSFFEGFETLPTVYAKLGDKPTIRPGKFTFRTVSLVWRDNILYAYPHNRRLGGSTLLSSLSQGNGYIMIPPNLKPKKGDYIKVKLFSHYEFV